MIDLKNMSYMAEYDRDWKDGLDACKCLQDLKDLVAKFSPLVESAAKIVNNMTTEAQFKSFRKSLKKERKGQWCMDDSAGTIIIPDPMMKISVIAFQFHVPFGCAFNRMKSLGMLHIVDGKIIFRQDKTCQTN